MKKSERILCNWYKCAREYDSRDAIELGIFRVCSEECERELVQMNPDLYGNYLANHEEPSPPAELLHNPLAFPNWS